MNEKKPSKKEVTLKKDKDIATVISKDGKKKFVIRPKAELKFEIEEEKNKEVEKKVNVKVYEKGSDEKFGKDAKEETDKNVKFVYDKGTFWSNVGIKEVDSQEVEKVKNFKSFYHWPFWTTIVVFSILVVGGIVWWVMASRKGDKEEGDL